MRPWCLMKGGYSTIQTGEGRIRLITASLAMRRVDVLLQVKVETQCSALRIPEKVYFPHTN